MTDKNMDSRRPAAVSTVNGLPGRKHRLRDSIDEDRKVELKEALRSRDREQFKRKDRDRDFLKRRRVDNNNRSTRSSEDEYFEEDDGIGTGPSQLSNNRRGIDTQRSSPALRETVDEVIGVRIPRRARSASAKKLQGVLNSGSGDSKSTPSPDSGSPIGSGSASGASMKKKKYVGPRSGVLTCQSNSKSSPLIQNDIEIEVAEALFDLMTQSHSKSRPSDIEACVHRDGISTVDELKGSKPESGKVEKGPFNVQNEESFKANSEAILFGSMNNNKGVEKEKSGDDPAQESMGGNGFVDGGKVGSQKEMESTSCVKRNAHDIQDPIVTKADYAAGVVDSNNKKDARVVIDLMEPLSLPSSLERNTLPDTDPNVMARDAQKKSEVTPRIGVISDYQLPILNSEKKRRQDGISSVGDTSQQPQGWRLPNIQSPASLLSYPIGVGSWPCVLPHPGYSPPVGTRPSMTMQPPQFKFVKPRTRRSTTHLLIADSIRNHNQLVTKSLSSSGPTNGGGVATLYGTKPLGLKSMIPTQKLTPGKDKSSDAAADFTTVGKSVFLQQVSNQAPTHNLNSGFTLGLGHHQPANSSGGPSQSNLSRKIPPNSSLPEAQFFNQHTPYFPSNEAAASYMAMLQSGGRSIPIPTNISLPSFKNGPSLLNSSFYSPPMFNMAPPSQKSHDNKSSSQPEKNRYHVGSNKHTDFPQHFSLPFGSNIQMPPEGKSQTDSKSDNPMLASFYHHQHQMQQMLLKGVSPSSASVASASQPDYLSFLPKWDNFPRPTTAQEGSSRVKSLQGQTPRNTTTLGNSNSPSSAQVAINNQRNNASAVQETEGSPQNGGSTPACRGVVASIFSSCSSQLPEVKYG